MACRNEKAKTQVMDRAAMIELVAKTNRTTKKD